LTAGFIDQKKVYQRRIGRTLITALLEKKTLAEDTAPRMF
jgi:hypothetical protein